ncbi:hypothetical protein M8C21_019408 [Ambrosia artemisiifolia]|uniref:Uncharacterized protein n=1 Tax=Ambrosia artemisiifolia TaxID=4212 RepID=A0AAD5GHF4_AMBAR|nr:hypothetical protein M8C21_019408 [Ambrosia artemisiifolia]
MNFIQPMMSILHYFTFKESVHYLKATERGTSIIGFTMMTTDILIPVVENLCRCSLCGILFLHVRHHGGYLCTMFIIQLMMSIQHYFTGA